jgi:hypothetical protein
MIRGEHIIETIVCIVIACWILATAVRRWRMRGKVSARDRREMQESIRRFQRRDHNNKGTWR